MILKATILKLLTAAFGGTTAQGGSGIGGFLADAINGVVGVGTNHSGGMAGTGPKRAVWMENLIDSTRYHTGGVVGLKPDEIPAILQKNEEVLIASDPRHRFNGGAVGPAAAPNIKIINAIDAGDMLSQGANTTVGERAILNVIRNNASGVRTAIGVPG